MRQSATYRRQLVPVLCAVALSMLAWRSARAETRPGYGGTIIGGLLGEPVHLDPVRAHSHTDVAVVTLLFDTLYRVAGKAPDGDLRVVPHVAAALPVVSDNGTVARIAVRTDIVFHDKKSLRAEDVKRSLERLRKQPAAGYLLAPVKSIAREGDELVVRLYRPTPELALLLTAPASSITPRGRAPTWRRAIGSGPFKLSRRDPASRRLRLSVHNRYFAGRPYVNALDLRWHERADDEATAYESGRSHYSLRDAVAYQGHTPKYRTNEAMGPATILSYVGFGSAGSHSAIVENKDFRQALSLAIERGGFRGIGSGERVSPTVHPVAAAVGGPSAGDRQRRARLREAGTALSRAARSVRALRAPPNGGPRSFELELIVDRTRLDDQDIAAKVVAALFQLGVRAHITSLEAAEFAERVQRGSCDLYIGQLAMPGALSQLTLAAAFAVGGDRWSLDTLRKGPLDRVRAGRIFTERLPVVPLFHRALRVHHRENVRGIHFDDTSRLYLDDVFFHGKVRRSK